MILAAACFTAVAAIAGASGAKVSPQPAQSGQAVPPKSVFDFTVSNIDGHPVKLSEYKGDVLLIVNTASLCGNTPQYKKLEELYQKYHSKGLTILGFPENDFMNQEPGSNAEIKEFCTSVYHVSFPMFAKIDVKGEHEAPLYKWLIAHSLKPKLGIQWNFEKFLLDRDGQVIMRIDPGHQPDSDDVVKMIEKALAEQKPADSTTSVTAASGTQKSN